MSHDRVHTAQAPAALGPYSQALTLHQGPHTLVFTAGQVGLDPSTGEMVEGGVEAQVRRAMENLAAVLEAAGSGFDRVLKTTIFLADMGDFAACNAIYAEYFTSDPPARSTVQVAALPKDGRVEIEMVAYA